MNKIIKKIEKKQINNNIPNFRSGDLIKVETWVIEGSKKRLQSFEGIVISIRNRYLNSSYTVRKLSHGEGIERVFQKYSPIINKVIIKKKGFVKKSKLYYLRKLKSKFIKIKEKLK